MNLVLCIVSLTVLTLTGKYRELQRLTGQYAKLLDLDLEHSADTMDIEV